jgi:hypothetical protein
MPTLPQWWRGICVILDEAVIPEIIRVPGDAGSAG